MISCGGRRRTGGGIGGEMGAIGRAHAYLYVCGGGGRGRGRGRGGQVAAHAYACVKLCCVARLLRSKFQRRLCSAGARLSTRLHPVRWHCACCVRACVRAGQGSGGARAHGAGEGAGNHPRQDRGDPAGQAAQGRVGRALQQPAAALRRARQRDRHLGLHHPDQWRVPCC
jgi:hypothetical protein